MAEEASSRVFYKFKDETLYIVTIIDGRRNIEDILYRKPSMGGSEHASLGEDDGCVQGGKKRQRS